jgi:hypothetical protein
MNMNLLNKVGGIVATEIHGLSTWIGDTNVFYVKTDVDPKTLHFHNLKEHIIEKQEDSFPNSFRIVAFNVT